MRLIDADALFESLIFPSEQWKLSFKQILDDEPTAYPNERIKVLIDATKMSFEEILAESAITRVCCDSCPISEFCDQHPYWVNEATQLGCSDIWKLYLKGEEDAEET